MKIFFTFLGFLIIASAYSSSFVFASEGKFRLRAREHYEIHKITSTSAGIDTTYKGFSNTINAWYEIPYYFSIGLAFSPILASMRNESSPVREFGDSLKLYSLGIESKYFPWHAKKLRLFARSGLGWSRLSTKGSVSFANGWHGYLGLGWEIPVWKLAIAPEFALRQTFLQSDIKIFSITPSVGLHFYGVF